MNYKNDKLNILVENSEYFKIETYGEYIKLYADKVLKFEIYRNSKLKAYENSTVMAYGNSTVYAYNNSTIYAYDNSTVYAYGNPTVNAYYNSTVESYDNSRVEAYGNSRVKAFNNSTINAFDNSTIYAYNNSIVKANDNAIVNAYGDSKVNAYDNATVYADDFATVYKNSVDAVVKKDNPFVKVFDQVFKVPEDMLVYKKLRDNKIAVLKLEKGQVFQSEHHYKCRTNKALVVAIESIDGKEKYDIGYSNFDKSFVYKVGETVSTDYDEQINECSKGIHFFLSRKSAELY